jgi:hypothetical protein
VAIVRETIELYAETVAAVTRDLAIPSGAAAGEYAILMVGNRVAANPATQPSGWDIIRRDATSGAAHNLTTFGRVLQAGDLGGTVTVAFPTSCEVQGGMVTYSGVDPDNPLDVTPTATLNNAVANTHQAPQITPANNDTMLVHGWVCGGGGNFWASVDTGTIVFNQATGLGTQRSTLLVERAGPASGVGSSAIIATLNAGGVQAATMHTAALRAAADGAPPDPGDPNQLVIGRARW